MTNISGDLSVATVEAKSNNAGDFTSSTWVGETDGPVPADD